MGRNSLWPSHGLEVSIHGRRIDLLKCVMSPCDG